MFERMLRGPSDRQLMSMGATGTLFAIVDQIAESVSGAEWKLWRKAESGKIEDRTEVVRHAALDLWNKPNSFMTRQEFVEVVQQHFELTGEQWWIASRSTFSGIGPIELWPVRPDKMEPVPHRTEYLAGYVYHGPDGEKVPLGLDEVVFLRRPNPMDAYRGIGPVQSVLADIDSIRFSAEWNRAFFQNNAEPGGVVKFDHRLDDNEWREFQARWAEGHKGINNAHRVAILENGSEWVDRKYTHRDMQFAELAQVSDEKIRKAFRFPKPMLGSVDDVNRANAEAGEVVYARWIVKRRLERIKQALNNDLLPMFGEATTQNLEFDFENPVPDDREADNNELTAKANAASALVGAGWSDEDVCAAVGLPMMRFVGRRDSGPEQPAGTAE